MSPETSSEKAEDTGEKEERVVGREVYTRKSQIGKELIGDINGEEIFRPWMLAKKKEVRNSRQRQERKDNIENHGKKDKGGNNQSKNK